MAKDFMEFGKALELVLELARENALEEQDIEFDAMQEVYDRQQVALSVVEDFITNFLAEENGSVFLCHKCKGMVEEEDVLWVDPETTLATMGERGRPYHAGCAPEQKQMICVICGGEIEDIDHLYIMSSGQFCHNSCV